MCNKFCRDRIGAICWYETSIGKKPMWVKGFLRAWSTDSQQHGESFEVFPVGIIENMETNQCVSVYITNICFAEEQPS